MKKQKSERAICQVCLHPEFIVTKACDGRPKFICTRCRNTWTCGQSGGIFIKSKFTKFVKEKENANG